jgi:hypothetical protein
MDQAYIRGEHRATVPVKGRGIGQKNAEWDCILPEPDNQITSLEEK